MKVVSARGFYASTVHGLVVLVLFLIANFLWAATPSSTTDESHKGIPISAHDAYEMKMSRPAQVLLLDVRTRAELHYVGIADVIDANIPYRFETTQWKLKRDGKHGSFKTVKNPDFAAAVKNLVKQRNLNLDTPIIIMCKAGTISPWAAKALHKAGFTTLYSVMDGFEGNKAKDGPQKGKRVVNGWKNDGLPWSYNLLPEKMYFNFAPGNNQ